MQAAAVEVALEQQRAALAALPPALSDAQLTQLRDERARLDAAVAAARADHAALAEQAAAAGARAEDAETRAAAAVAAHAAAAAAQAVAEAATRDLLEQRRGHEACVVAAAAQAAEACADRDACRALQEAERQALLAAREDALR